METNTKECVKDALNFLKNEQEYNLENKILNSENIVINRLLTNKTLANDFFVEICEKLSKDQLQALLSKALSLAAFWSPESIVLIKKNKKELQNLNKKIGEIANNLASLLKERDDISNKGFYSHECYHVVELIDKASSENYLYESHLKDKLAGLSYQYDYKYWPETHEIVRVIAYDAKDAHVQASDNISKAAIVTPQSSLTDFFRAIYEAFSELKASNHRRLPTDFNLSDKAMASMVNSILEIDAESLVDAAYVKRLRQRLRNSK